MSELDETMAELMRLKNQFTEDFQTALNRIPNKRRFEDLYGTMTIKFEFLREKAVIGLLEDNDYSLLPNLEKWTYPEVKKMCQDYLDSNPRPSGNFRQLGIEEIYIINRRENAQATIDRLS
jgi:hypothetical protein